LRERRGEGVGGGEERARQNFNLISDEMLFAMNTEKKTGGDGRGRRGGRKTFNSISLEMLCDMIASRA